MRVVQLASLAFCLVAMSLVAQPVVACDKLRCAGVIGLCALSCGCDYPACECCPECTDCLADLYEECCSCFSAGCGGAAHAAATRTRNASDPVRKSHTSSPLRVSSSNKARLRAASPYTEVRRTEHSTCFVNNATTEEDLKAGSYGCDDGACMFCGNACPSYHPYYCCYGSSCCCYAKPGPCNIAPSCPMNGCV